MTVLRQGFHDLDMSQCQHDALGSLNFDFDEFDTLSPELSSLSSDRDSLPGGRAAGWIAVEGDIAESA